LARIGLNIPQAQVLYCLNEAKVRNEPMTPMRLSRVLQKQPHTVSALVHRMEAQGFVTTKKDMKRKNWLRVWLTRKGEEALRLWANATEVPDILSCLSKRETETMYTPDEKSTPKVWNCSERCSLTRSTQNQSSGETARFSLAVPCRTSACPYLHPRLQPFTLTPTISPYMHCQQQSHCPSP